MKRRLTVLLLVLSSCSSGYQEIPGTQLVFDTSANLEVQGSFYSMPWPSDLRLTSGGSPDMAAFVNESANSVVSGLLATVPYRQGFPVITTAYFQFGAALSAQSEDTVIPASKTSPILIVDVDPSSSLRGTLYPAVAATLSEDPYTPKNLLAVAPPPGLILYPNRKYAYVVMRSLKDASGSDLGIPLSFQQMKASASPGGAGAAAYTMYQPLWATLEKIGVSVSDVAAATVFTTGDVVQNLATMTTQLLAKYPVTIDPSTFMLNPTDNSRLCELQGTVTMPQFQLGTPPFNTEGNFVLGSDGLPELQGQMTIPMVVTLPKSPMPASGYPLMVYTHGSGGVSTEVVDRGPTPGVPGDCPSGLSSCTCPSGYAPSGLTDMCAANNPTPGQGPAYVVAQYGLAAAASALPLNPERLPGATDYEYLNPDNLPVFPFNFQQGVIEQRLFIQALKSLQIPASAVAGCTGPTLPSGATAFSFDPSHLVQMGQSMGAMYANMITATEPRIQAVVPTGAGGYWSDMILTTGLVPGQTILQGLLGVNQQFLYLHPALQLLETAWEPADPVVFTPRVALRPLSGAPARPIYEVVGTQDAYFSMDVLDAMALGYGNQEAGQQLWTQLQTSLALGGFEGMVPYSVSNNRTSLNGSQYTGVVVEYANDGILSGHDVAFQLDAVKYQYSCFLESFLATGTATVFDPPAGFVETTPTPCPGG